MVQTSTSVLMAIAVIVSFLIIVIPFLLFKKDRSLLFKTLSAGAMVFIFADLFIRGTIVSLILGSAENAVNMMNNQPIVYALIVAVTTAVVHFFVRLLIAKGIVKNELEKDPRKSAISMGFGQAGLESIYTIGIVYIQHLMLINKINDGSIYQMISETISKEQIDLYVTTIQGYQVLPLLMIVLKIVMTTVMMIALTLMTVNAIKQKDKKSYLLIVLVNISTMFILLYLELLNVYPVIIMVVILIYIVLFGRYALQHIKGARLHDERI